MVGLVRTHVLFAGGATGVWFSECAVSFVWLPADSFAVGFILSSRGVLRGTLVLLRVAARGVRVSTTVLFRALLVSPTSCLLVMGADPLVLAAGIGVFERTASSRCRVSVGVGCVMGTDPLTLA